MTAPRLRVFHRVGRPLLRPRGIPESERSLDDDGVCPTIMFETDRFQVSRFNEVKGFMQAQGRLIGRVDIADHLPETGRCAGVDETRE